MREDDEPAICGTCAVCGPVLRQRAEAATSGPVKG